MFVVGVCGDVPQLGLPGVAAHADGEDGDAKVPETLSLVGGGGGVVGFAVGDHDGDLGSVGPAVAGCRLQFNS